MFIDCTYYSEGKTILSERFWHQLMPKYFIFTWIRCTCSLNHKQYSPKSFAAKSCQNISFLHVLSPHHIPKANQHSPRYFSTKSCRNIQCSHIIPQAKQYSPKYFATNSCQNISFSHGFSAHPPCATNNISWVFWC